MVLVIKQYLEAWQLACLSDSNIVKIAFLQILVSMNVLLFTQIINVCFSCYLTALLMHYHKVSVSIVPIVQLYSAL